MRRGVRLVLALMVSLAAGQVAADSCYGPRAPCESIEGPVCVEGSADYWEFHVDTGRVVTLEKRPYRMTVPKACIACQLTLSWSYEPGKCEKEVRLPDIKAEIRALAKKSGTDYVEPVDEPAPAVAQEQAAPVAPAPAEAAFVAAVEPAAAAAGEAAPAPESAPAATDAPAADLARTEPLTTVTGDAAPTPDAAPAVSDEAVATASPAEPTLAAVDAAAQATVVPDAAVASDAAPAVAEPMTVAASNVVVADQPPPAASPDAPFVPACTGNSDGCSPNAPAEMAAPTGEAGEPPL